MRAAPAAAAAQRARLVSLLFSKRTEPNRTKLRTNRTEPNRTESSIDSRNPPPNRDSDIWAIYARLCIHDTLDHIENATLVVDPDIESLNPGYAQPAYR